MPQTVIKIENVSKQYRLGSIGSGTFSNDLNRWWHAIRGKDDPYIKIGDENDRTQKGKSEYVWALKDVSFEISQGDIVGIVGRNGAGKSTLLKILSRTTLPTLGSLKVKGRIASLLEVGTGFHPELSGRENIFLNGAILGMTKNEITRNFDGIVDFAGVEKYIDTPVKRYSSGMYVRLAFAVAAHLNPDILIIDEVLAVGDIEFQKKALGKMEKVSRDEGRTVLFVSHNIGALRMLCKTGVFLQNGKVDFIGAIDDTLAKYLETNSINDSKGYIEWTNEDAPGNGQLNLIYIASTDEKSAIKTEFQSFEQIVIHLRFRVLQKIVGSRFVIQFVTTSGEVAFASTNHSIMQNGLEPGVYESTCIIPGNLLNSIRYIVRLHAGTPGQQYIFKPIDLLLINVIGSGHHGSIFNENWPGVVTPYLKWTLQNGLKK